MKHLKRLEVLFERLSSAGLILYLAGIFGLILSIVAVIVKVTTLSEILILRFWLCFDDAGHAGPGISQQSGK